MHDLDIAQHLEPMMIDLPGVLESYGCGVVLGARSGSYTVELHLVIAKIRSNVPVMLMSPTELLEYVNSNLTGNPIKPEQIQTAINLGNRVMVYWIAMVRIAEQLVLSQMCPDRPTAEHALCNFIDATFPMAHG